MKTHTLYFLASLSASVSLSLAAAIQSTLWPKVPLPEQVCTTNFTWSSDRELCVRQGPLPPNEKVSCKPGYNLVGENCEPLQSYKLQACPKDLTRAYDGTCTPCVNETFRYHEDSCTCTYNLAEFLPILPPSTASCPEFYDQEEWSSANAGTILCHIKKFKSPKCNK